MSARALHRFMTAACVSLSAASALPAQNAAEYARSAGDTLRYHNVTRMDGNVRGAAGDAPFTLSRDATFAFVFSGGDAVTAFYETLAIEASGALGGVKPNAEELIRAPFRLRMEPNGHVATVKAPDLPRTARLIAELPPGFDDFFPRLPATGTVRAGMTWVDTTVRNESDSTGRKIYQRRINHYRATGDSVIKGKSAVVISQHTEVRITSANPMQQAPYISELSLTGDEDGVSLFSVRDGRLISRDRKGELRGAVTYKGGDEPWVVPQTYHYHRTDTL
ncbi:MAG TPA: hypothetical protein VGQ30_00335, partial [Gemmatimonadaceae bacterium]|nr:hypothetical protein [Gemmatimonadaceae bacterium]